MIDRIVPDGHPSSCHRGPSTCSSVTATTPETSSPADLRREIRATIARLEMLALNIRRIIGDPYGRPIRPQLRPVPCEPEGVSDEQ